MAASVRRTTTSTTVTRLSADSDADGFYLIETSGLVIGQTAITVARVDSNAGTGTDPSMVCRTT